MPIITTGGLEWRCHFPFLSPYSNGWLPASTVLGLCCLDFLGLFYTLLHLFYLLLTLCGPWQSIDFYYIQLSYFILLYLVYPLIVYNSLSPQWFAPPPPQLSLFYTKHSKTKPSCQWGLP